MLSQAGGPSDGTLEYFAAIIKLCNEFAGFEVNSHLLTPADINEDSARCILLSFDEMTGVERKGLNPLSAVRDKQKIRHNYRSEVAVNQFAFDPSFMDLVAKIGRPERCIVIVRGRALPAVKPKVELLPSGLEKVTRLVLPSASTGTGVITSGLLLHVLQV